MAIYPSPKYGVTPTACPAATATTVKTGAGALMHLSITGTGTTGTVSIKDGSTTLITYSIPATAGIYGPTSWPVEGMEFLTSCIITTAGTGVTALAMAV